MNENMINAVKNWLDSVMPMVVDVLAEHLTEETLHEMCKEEGIHGPIMVNLKECQAPISAINFYVLINDDSLMLATTADMTDADEDEDQTPNIEFDMFFTIQEFATSIKDENHIQYLKDRVLELYKKANG